MAALTPKQEAFCLAYIETGNASEAYRRSYNAANMQANTITVKASQLLAQDNVSVRVAELKAAQVERLGVTVDDLIAELDEARQIALAAAKPQSAAAVSATLGKAKLLGLLTEKIDANVKGVGMPVIQIGVAPE